MRFYEIVDKFLEKLWF